MFRIAFTVLLLTSLSGCQLGALYGERGVGSDLSHVMLTLDKTDKASLELRAHLMAKSLFSVNNEDLYELELITPAVQKTPYALNREGVRSVEQVTVVLHCVLKDRATKEEIEDFSVRAHAPILVVKDHRTTKVLVESAIQKATWEAADLIPQRVAMILSFLKKK